MKSRTWLVLALALLAFIGWGAFTTWYYYEFFPKLASKSRSEGVTIEPFPLPHLLLLLIVTLAIFYRWVKRRGT